MRKYLLSLAAPAALAIGAFAASPALACEESPGYECPYETYESTEAPTSNFNIEAKVQNGTAGLGVGYFEGDEGYALVEQTGKAEHTQEVWLNSGLCPGGCPDGHLSIHAKNQQHVLTQVGALSHQSGVPAIASGEAATVGQVKININASE